MQAGLLNVELLLAELLDDLRLSVPQSREPELGI